MRGVPIRAQTHLSKEFRLTLGFCEHYSSGTHPEMIVSLGQIGKVRSQFTLAGCTLRTKGLVAMLALSASASSSRLE